MKLHSFLLCAFVVAASSCNHEPAPLESSDSFRYVDFELCGQAPVRSSVGDVQSDVLSLDFLAFRHDSGALETSDRVTGENLTGISVNLRTGIDIDWFIIANAPDGAFAGVFTESDFLTGLSNITESMGSCLVLYSSGVLASDDLSSSAVEVELSRYASKVSLGSVSVTWLDSFTTVPSVTFGRVSLVNVVGTCPYSGIPAIGSVWYNQMSVNDNSYGLFVYDEQEGYGIVDSSSFQVEAELYCMPNPTDNGVDSILYPDWSVRDTRIAVELVIDGVSNWYPIDIPSMSGNTHYRINRLVITGPGSDSPDKHVIRSNVEFSVEIVPWEYIESVPEFPMD